MDKKHAADLLQTVPVFADLAPAELIEVLKIAKEATFKPDEWICSQGEPGRSMYVIESGSAEVSLDAGFNQPLPVASLEIGDVFGELSLIDEQPRSANVVARSEVRAYRFDRTDFNAMRRDLSPAAYKVMRRMALTTCARLRGVEANVTAERGGRPRFTSVISGLPAPLPRSATDASRSFWRGVLRWVGRG